MIRHTMHLWDRSCEGCGASAEDVYTGKMSVICPGKPVTRFRIFTIRLGWITITLQLPLLASLYGEAL